MSAPARVLVADDSPFLCRLLTRYLEEAGGFHVVGTALSGRDAIHEFRRLSPDVVALDLTLPDIDGLDVLREIRSSGDAPVVIITGASGMDAVLTLRALEAGANDFIMKFDPLRPKSPDTVRSEIVTKIRRAANRSLATAPAPPPDSLLPAVVVIGASTGGPTALRQILPLPDSFGAAVVVVQHMPAALSARLAADLQRFSRLPLTEIGAGDRLRAGAVGVAPGGMHLAFEPHRRVALSKYTGESDCPSIDIAMESAAAVYGPAAVGVLLTGMGADGVHGMARIRDRGGKTLVQDPSTCVVAGMPGAAIARGAAEFIGSPEAIASRLSRIILPIPGDSHAN